MADLVAADLTYTHLDDGVIIGASRVRRRIAITTAAGDYPTGGLPLTNGSLGCPTELESVLFLEQDIADPLLTYQWDKSANTIVVMEDDGSTGVPAEHANATFTDPDELIIEVVGY